MSFRKPCHMPFPKLIPLFTLTGQTNVQLVSLQSASSNGFYYAFVRGQRTENSVKLFDSSDHSNDFTPILSGHTFEFGRRGNFAFCLTSQEVLPLMHQMRKKRLQ